MKKQIIAAMVVSSLTLSNVSYASDTSDERQHHEELIGLSSGIVLGAVVAGPVGAIIGAFTGTIIGKSVGDESELDAQQTLLAMQESKMNQLSDENLSLMAISNRYDSAQHELAQLKTAEQQKLAELSLGLNVQFKTGSSELVPHFKLQLDDVAYAMSLSPELRLDLTGYADRRGDSTYNQALSEQRVAEVKTYLVNQGVDESRLDFRAYGASAPMTEEQSFENDFFDRRVTVKLLSTESALTANN